jgi:hypothetical protein
MSITERRAGIPAPDLAGAEGRGDDPGPRATGAPCPGCGGRFPHLRGPTHRYMESSPGCWAAYGDVMARAYQDPTHAEYYRFSVDAYAVQHPGQPSLQSIQSVGVHLVRLYLLLDRGLGMARANNAILGATAIKHTFHWLQPPPSMGRVTVADVAPVAALPEFREAVATWARSAWEAWSPHHATIARWAADLPESLLRQTTSRSG